MSDIERRKKDIKSMIEQLINDGRYDEARLCIEDYERVVENDIDIYSMKGVIFIYTGDYGNALDILKKGLRLDKSNFELNYNIAHVYSIIGNLFLALQHSTRAYETCSYENIKSELEATIKTIKEKQDDSIVEERKNIVFFVKQGMDNFIDDIIYKLSSHYDTRKVVVNKFQQIDDCINEFDICWFEWCDELIEYASKKFKKENQKFICRIHGYEVYSDFVKKTNWKNVDNLIIVAPHIKRLFEENTLGIDKGNLKIDLVFCGIDISKYPVFDKQKGFNIGYLGYINYKKNIPLTLEIFKNLYDLDNRYQLYLAGQFQDLRTLEYYKYFIREFKLEGNIHFDGWKNADEKIQWLKKIDYMLISSIDEGLCYAAAEAMSCGIKPVLHNCEGIKDHYDRKYIFNKVKEAEQMILSEEYNSYEYRSFINNRYDIERKVVEIRAIIEESICLEDEACLVTS